MRVGTWIAILLGAFLLAQPVLAEEPASDEAGTEATDEATPPVETEPAAPAPDTGESGSESE